MNRRKFFYYLAVLLVVPIFMLTLSNLVIENYAADRTFSDVNEIPKNKVGLVLGTSSRLVEGGINPYYAHRIEATVQLFEAGKIRDIFDQRKSAARST